MMFAVKITVDNTPTPWRERLRLWWKYECKPLRKIHDAWYWIRTHTYNRYHMVDVRNERNGYSWGWIDASEKILFANFALLVDFIEKEKAFGSHVDWKWDEGHADAEKELKRLYWWWKVDRKRQHDVYEDLLTAACDSMEQPLDLNAPETPGTRALWDKCYSEEQRLIDVDTQNTISLIKLRGYLWT